MEFDANALTQSVAFGQTEMEANQKKSTHQTIDSCRICGNRCLTPILSLGEQALTGIFPKSKDDLVISGPLDLVRCDETVTHGACGLVQLRQTYNKTQMFSGDYGYRSGLNPSMVEHLRHRVGRILELVPLQEGDLVLDIGSNDGTLLGFYPSNVERVGIDPTGAFFQAYYPSPVVLIPHFFSERIFQERFSGRKAKVITSIAMFYDLDEPLHFMRQIYRILADDGVWVLEQSYLPTLLAVNSYDTICHEHLEYYRLKTILWMIQEVGFKVIDLERNDVNGGSFSVTLAKANALYQERKDLIGQWLHEEEGQGLSTSKPYDSFRSRVTEQRQRLQDLIHRMSSQGQRIIGYGASTKGNVILQYCQLSPQVLPCIGEVNEKKYGCYTPGTRIPIVSEREAKALKPNILLILPWHFKSFFLQKEKAYLASGGKLFFPLPEPTLC